MNKNIRQLIKFKERGQAIILVAFGIVGLVAMVGLVTDTGIIFIEYGKLKRGVDAASIAAAQQYRSVSGGSTLDQIALENAAKNFLQLNQSDITSIEVHSCEDVVVADRPDQCNADPVGHPELNRKLVEVSASKYVGFGFLRVIGSTGTNISTSAVGEAASLDLVLVIDTSASMAYATTGAWNLSDPGSAISPGDDPSECNVNNSCEPMKTVKDTALNFIDTMYFPYDRVAIVTMTSQTPGDYPSQPVDREPMQVIPLTSVKADVVAAINSIKVFDPGPCVYETDPNVTPAPGSCLGYDPGTGYFQQLECPFYDWTAANNTLILSPDFGGTYQTQFAVPDDYSSCNSSNVGGTLISAASILSDPLATRPESFWVVVALMGGPANTTSPRDDLGLPWGFCPENTWPSGTSPHCRDRKPSVRHAIADTISYQDPITSIWKDIPLYDADDFARDSADQLATLTSNSGVTIYTIGLGSAIQSTSTVDAGEPPAAENLLQYISECAGENSADDCATPVANPNINHGQYFYAPNSAELVDIFELIANNIATRITQ